MEDTKIIGNNIKMYRKNLGLSQDQVATYLGVDRSLITKYETTGMDIPIIHLNKLSDLFSIELGDLLEKEKASNAVNLAFAFRTDSLNVNDLESIASFQKVVKNYLKMKKLVNE